MLDKSIPYYSVIMKRPSGAPLPDFKLPEGYSFVRFKKGDELAWAEIEASVGEFDSVREALLNFQVIYLPSLKELERRLIFVVSPDGEKVATYTNWWNYSGELRIPSVHWVAVKPNFQGLGLGKAIIFQGIHMSLAIEGDRDVYLHTQTWSYKAIALYIQAGFEILKKGTFGTYKNEYKQAKPYLIEKGLIR